MVNVLDRFKKDIKGIGLLTVGIFVGLSLASFNPEDPSFNSVGQGFKVTNWCGYAGSFLSDFLYQMLGVSAWFVVVMFVRFSFAYFKKQNVEVKNVRTIWGVLLMLTVSSLLGLHFSEHRLFSNQIIWGGVLGLTLAQGLKLALNFVGATVVLWSMALILIVFYSEKTVQEILKYLLQVGKNFQSKFKIEAKKLNEKDLSEQRPFFSIWPIKTHESNTKAEFLKLTPNDEFQPHQMKSSTEVYPLLAESEGGIPGAKSDGVSTQNAINTPRRKVVLKAKIQRKVENWELPKISLLEDPPSSRIKLDEKEIRRKAEILVDKLSQFGVNGTVVGVKPGPAVTMFEFRPNSDVRLSRITDLADDLSLALSSESVRIIAPIPGRDVVGIETSNSQRESVYLKDILALEAFWSDGVKLPIPLGRQANGDPRVVDLRRMPHLLVAGTTGSGKSVFTVSTLTALLFKHSPKTLRLILVDPKQVDLAAFSKVPHLIMPPVSESKKAVLALKWAVREMEKRYRSMSRFQVRDLESFNSMAAQMTEEQVEEHHKLNEEFELTAKAEQYYFSPLPYIVIVVEEFGDLMAVDKINVEQVVVRLAQMARACGIHLLLAMQSPRREVVTGLIKTNIPGRISFKVASKMDSRIILDEAGAERLLARGDMLFLSPGVAKAERHHGPWLSEAEISMVTRFWASQGEPEFDGLAMKVLEGSGTAEFSLFDLNSSEGEVNEEQGDDEMYEEILNYVSTLKEVSASFLQRKYRLGYPRAARMIEILEKRGVVGAANGSKPRQVLFNEASS